MNAQYAESAPSFGTYLSDEQAMRLAISEAYKGAVFAGPNPLVGAVVLDAQNKFISSGYHEKYGGPHAEVNAFKNLTADQLKQSRVFVTLEPCAHEGKTPSCAKMMAQYPLGHVTVGLVDPNPLVAGQGLEILKAAGISTSLYKDGAMAVAETCVQLEEVCEVFLWNYRQRKTFVALKLATSLDGQMALNSGESRWITNEDSRQHVHYLRACYDAILVGKNTLKFDNPSLNVRRDDIQKEIKAVVLDTKAEMLPSLGQLNLSKAHAPEKIFWCVSNKLQAQKDELQKFGVNILFCEESEQGHLDLHSVMQQLYNAKVYSLFVEGGSRVASEFVNCGLVNRLYLFQAPIIMGAGGSQSWTGSLSLTSMQDRIFLKQPRVMTFGNDVMISGVLN